MKPGKVTGSDLRRYVLRQIHNTDDRIINSAAIGVDCAIFSVKDTDYVATCMQEAAVAGKADMEVALTVEQLFTKTANNLWAEGATPVAATVTILLPENAESDRLKSIMQDADRIANALGMPIAGGQSRITKAVNLSYAIVTGYGIIKDADAKGYRRAKPEQDIVISKWIGLEGTAFLAKHNRDKILERYPAYFVNEAESFDRYMSVRTEALTAIESGTQVAMHDISEGGVFAALWEMAEYAGLGLTVDIKKIPIRQETIEVCECLGVNPYELKSGGSLIIACDDGETLVQKLHEKGVHARCIGKFKDSNDRLILNEDEVRYMDRPKVDELYKKMEKR